MLVKVCCGNEIYKILTTDDVRQRLMVLDGHCVLTV